MGQQIDPQIAEELVKIRQWMATIDDRVARLDPKALTSSFAEQVGERISSESHAWFKAAIESLLTAVENLSRKL